jgi:glyoxalase family protein
VAWRVAGESDQLELRDRLSRAGLQPTDVIDRQYFRSVYFREPGNVLFELATDGPGFTVDEPVERLGTGLMLPPRYEQQRERIVSRLPALERPR